MVLRVSYRSIPGYHRLSPFAQGGGRLRNGIRVGRALMLHEIHIQNYAVIDELTVEFHSGLNLLSGETGSGKSIVIDALGLALGGRAATDVIRTGCDRATITAFFRAPELPAWQTLLADLGVEGADGEEIIFRRMIHSNGRSRLLLNDQPVTASGVREIGRASYRE